MSSFSDNLEMLETAPRFIDLPDLAKLRRDSSVGRVSRNSSVIFLSKRERLESGDFGAGVQDSRAKRDFASIFPALVAAHKTEEWTAEADSKNNQVLACEQLVGTFVDGTNVGRIEAESVIDHKLTVGKDNEDLSESTEPDAISPFPKLAQQPESKFLIKVKRTDSTIVLSGRHSEMCNYEPISDCDLPQSEEAMEERTSNLIFADEPTRLRAKMAKVTAYWHHASLLVPNVFRHIKLCDEASDAYLELQDYSRKELLVQSNGTKFKPGSQKDKSGATKKVKKASGAGVKKA